MHIDNGLTNIYVGNSLKSQSCQKVLPPFFNLHIGLHNPNWFIHDWCCKFWLKYQSLHKVPFDPFPTWLNFWTLSWLFYLFIIWPVSKLAQFLRLPIGDNIQPIWTIVFADFSDDFFMITPFQLWLLSKITPWW